MYYQQGDCLLKAVSDSPSVVEVSGDLLHKGTQHHHRLRGGFKLGKKDNDTFVMVSKEGAELFHEEHKTLSLPEGLYQLGFVQEYDHFLEEARNVID